MKYKKKPGKPKPRIKVAPPSKRHKSVKDYDRKELKKELNKSIKECDLSNVIDVSEIKDNPHAGSSFEDFLASVEKQRSWNWFDSFMALFGFKRK